jgi:hypothetical protein
VDNRVSQRKKNDGAPELGARESGAGTVEELSQEASPETGAADEDSMEAPTPEAGVLPQKLQAHIGRHLQAMYDEVAHEPVPDRLLNLLQELERKEKNG